MLTCAVLATGPSMSQRLADTVRERCRAVAVSDAFRLAPWADALVSHDPRWWEHHHEALKFAGRRFCGSFCPGTETITQGSGFDASCNSGLQAMRVAHYVLGAQRLLLLGFDLHGTHYFGPHAEPLQNTTDARFAAHIRQFNAWRGCEVVNCTPHSALTRFAFADLKTFLDP